MASLVRIIVEGQVEFAEGEYSHRTVVAGMVAGCRTEQGQGHILAAGEAAEEEAAGVDWAGIAGIAEDLEEAVRRGFEAELECIVQGEVRIDWKDDLSTEIVGPMAFVRRLRWAGDVEWAQDGTVEVEAD